MIRPLIPDDFELFYNIRLQALQTDPEAFTSTAADWQQRPRPDIEKRFRQSTTSPDQFILGAFVDDEIAGMLGFQRFAGPKIRHKGFIWGVFLAPEARGQGLGREMLEFALRMAKGMTDLEIVQISVMAQNIAARTLYESSGFTTYGIEKSAVMEGERRLDEHHMQLFLTATEG